MLFVDDDESKVFEGRKYGGTCADDDRHLPAAYAIPLIRALPVRQTAVLHGHAVAEGVTKGGRDGGSQGDLGHHHENRSAAMKNAIGEPKVHLRFTGSRDPLQQKYPKLLCGRSSSEGINALDCSSVSTADGTR